MLLRCNRKEVVAMRMALTVSAAFRDLVSGEKGDYMDGLTTVLVILDRNVDLVPMLSHSWTYQALVHDVLDMKLNRVTVEVRSSEMS